MEGKVAQGLRAPFALNFMTELIDPTDLISLLTAARLRDTSYPAVRELARHKRLRFVEIDGKRYLFRSEVLAFKPGRRQQVRLMSNEEVLNEVRRVAHKLGHWPNTVEYMEHGEINLIVLWHRFGKRAQVLKAAWRS
jgi:Homing endonuclease associated repeat